RSLRDWSSDVCSSDLFTSSPTENVASPWTITPSCSLRWACQSTTPPAGMSAIGPGDVFFIPGGVRHKVVAHDQPVRAIDVFYPRSEERRVGKECRARG